MVAFTAAPSRQARLMCISVFEMEGFNIEEFLSRPLSRTIAESAVNFLKRIANPQGNQFTIILNNKTNKYDDCLLLFAHAI